MCNNFSVFVSLIIASTVSSVSYAKVSKSEGIDPFQLYSTEDFFNLEGFSSSNLSSVLIGGSNRSCTGDELSQFPVRMRTWLFNVMQQLSSYPESEGGLTEGERQLLYQAQEMEESNYIIPVHWKFLTLDQDKSESLKSEEIKDFLSMLSPIEGCIDQFLAEVCDSDSDGVIGRLEWSLCLRLTAEESELAVAL